MAKKKSYQNNSSKKIYLFYFKKGVPPMNGDGEGSSRRLKGVVAILVLVLVPMHKPVSPQPRNPETLNP